MRHTRPTASRRSNGQAGYTLIEMVVVLALLGILAVAVNQAIVHTVRVGNRGTDSMTAIAQMESAFHWLTIDVQQAQEIRPSTLDGFPLLLTWTAWDGSTYAVTYTLEDGEMTRGVSVNEASPTGMVIARYLSIDAAETNCRFPTRGTFTLPDASDAFAITGGQQTSSGTVTVTAGGVSASLTGAATYTGTSTSGTWTTSVPGDAVTFSASGSGASGTWSFAELGARVGLSSDEDGDAVLTGNALIVTLTASGGDGSRNTETREGTLFSRS